MQEHQSTTSATQSSGRYIPPKLSKPEEAKKSEKNLYEPYVTPAFFWGGLRVFARFLFFLLLDIRLVAARMCQRRGRILLPPIMSRGRIFRWCRVI